MGKYSMEERHRPQSDSSGIRVPTALLKHFDLGILEDRRGSVPTPADRRCTEGGLDGIGKMGF